MCIQAIEILSEALWCIIFVQVACSASCRIKKCDDLEINVKMSLNNIQCRIGLRVSLKWLYILRPIVVRN